MNPNDQRAWVSRPEADGLVAAWQRAGTFDARFSPDTWLIGIMKFKIIDHYRRSKRTPTDQNVESDEDGGIPIDSLFNSHGSWKVDPNHGLERLARAHDQLAANHEILAWVSTWFRGIQELVRCAARMKPGKCRTNVCPQRRKNASNR